MKTISVTHSTRFHPHTRRVRKVTPPHPILANAKHFLAKFCPVTDNLYPLSPNLGSFILKFNELGSIFYVYPHFLPFQKLCCRISTSSTGMTRPQVCLTSIRIDYHVWRQCWRAEEAYRMLQPKPNTIPRWRSSGSKLPCRRNIFGADPSYFW